MTRSRRAITRRGALAGAAGALAFPAILRAQEKRTIVDAARRKVEVTAQVSRVFAAGPPAAIVLFTLAPDLLLGWTSAFRPAEKEFIPERYAELPGVGRLTGRGNTANLEIVVASKPDLIFDYGTVDPTYVSLANRVQQQTGIPYILLDGKFERIAESYQLLGAAVDRRDAADSHASMSAICCARSTAGSPRYRPRSARASITAADRRASTPALPARSTPRSSSARAA
jgi:iron complex transport system substrate-binding protein